MRVSEFKGSLVFLHEVARGAADRSYGIQVAKLAGLPASVVGGREKCWPTSRRRGRAARSIPCRCSPTSRTSRRRPRDDALREAVAALDPDA